jgi:hypothetical protein
VPLLPERPNIEHLKKQAKDLLRDYETGDAASFVRLRNSLPAAEGKLDSTGSIHSARYTERREKITTLD